MSDIALQRILRMQRLLSRHNRFHYRNLMKIFLFQSKKVKFLVLQAYKVQVDLKSFRVFLDCHHLIKVQSSSEVMILGG